MKVCIMTLGCKVNRYESDALALKLNAKGIETTDKLEKADVYIINTCAVTAEAEKKSRQMIARCKKFNKDARIIICGCASQRDDHQFKIKGAQVVIGTAQKSKLVELIGGGNMEKSILPTTYEDDLLAQQSRTRAYIKIQDGCNNFCSYCIIPYLRGRSRSRKLESIVSEASKLSDEIKEIVVTGINVTDYKIDGKPALLQVLTELDKLGKRVRLSSLEETLVSEEFMSGLAKLNNFCPHFHLSLQSGCDSVLKRMNRKYNTQEFAQSVKLIRKYFPLAGITTDVIVGFPGESDEEFEQTCEFIKKIKFSSLHIFKYSRREGTVASKMKDLYDSIKSKRSDVLEKIKEDLQTDFVKQNKFLDVLIEEKEGDFYVGYSKNYIKCYISSDDNLINKVVRVQILQPYNGAAKCKIV